MRQPQNAKRSRGRQGNRKHNNRSLDSNGPNVRIRGSAAQIVDKYLTLASDANSSGDRIAAENFWQHAEHYQRLLNANQKPPMRHQHQQSTGAGSGETDSNRGESPAANEPQKHQGRRDTSSRPNESVRDGTAGNGVPQIKESAEPQKKEGNGELPGFITGKCRASESGQETKAAEGTEEIPAADQTKKSSTEDAPKKPRRARTKPNGSDAEVSQPTKRRASSAKKKTEDKTEDKAPIPSEVE